MEDAPKILKIPESECPDNWIRLPRTQLGHNHGPVWKIQSFPLNEICMVIFLAGLLRERQIGENPIEIRLGRKFPIGNASWYTVKKDYSCLCVWMTLNWLERDVESAEQKS